MLRVLLSLGNILYVREFCVSNNAGIYCLGFLETAFRLRFSAYGFPLTAFRLPFSAYRVLDRFGLVHVDWTASFWIGLKFSNWLQACYDLLVDAVNQIVNSIFSWQHFDALPK